MKSFVIFLVYLTLAFASFGYARHHYLDKHSITATNPFNKSQSATVTSPLADSTLFGDWVKEEWLFAIALPSVLVVAGLVMSVRK